MRFSTREVLLLATLLFFWNLWGTDLAAPDEPYFGEGAREMVVDGQWAVPHVNGVVTTDKPPLYFWLIALFSLPFGGVTSLTARLPSALAMLGSTALVLRLGKRLYGERVAVFSGLLFATNYLVWDKARSCQIDSLLCFLILVALSAFESFRAQRALGRRAGLLFWLACAFAVLAKGPVGLVLPLGIALVTLAWDGELRSWKRFAPVSGPLLFLAVIASWMALATIGGHGEYSVWGAFEEHVLSRAVHGMHHKQPFWYYAKVLPIQLLPWSGLIPAALVLAFQRKRARERFLLSWALFVVVFFSLSTEKRDLYVLPAYPAFLLLAAAVVEASLDRVLRWPHAAACVVVAGAGFALPVLVRSFGVVPFSSALVLGAVLVVTGALGAGAALRRRMESSLVCVGAGVAIAYLVLATLVLPALDTVRSARAFSRIVAAKTRESREAGQEVVAYRLGNLPEAIAYYTNGLYTRETDELDVLAAHLDRGVPAFAVADASQLDLLPGDLRSRLVTLDTTSLNGRKVALVGNGVP